MSPEGHVPFIFRTTANTPLKDRNKAVREPQEI